MAPEPLDHFKRGYRERADLRDRETTVLNVDFAGRPGDALSEFVRFKKETDYDGGREDGGGGGGRDGGGGGGGHDNGVGVAGGVGRDDGGGRDGRRYSNPDNNNNNHGGSGTPRNMPPLPVTSSSGGGGGGMDAPSLSGGPQPVLDVQRLVDRLCSGACHVEDELEQARHQYFTSFQGGKAITGILSNLARRRKIGIAMAIWNWMDTVGIQKNVFHYNSLISVCEKVRDHHKALALLEEMDRKNVRKNEVT